VTEETKAPGAAAEEWVVAAHVTAFAVGVAWAFGGNADWVRTPISIWGSAGIAVTAWLLSARRAAVDTRPLRWAAPVLLLNALILASALTPGFRPVELGAERFLVPVWVPWWRPSAARPDLALRSLWLFDGIYFSCLNIALAVRRRAVIRAILACVVGNGLLLAVFGTVQKLSGARGIYFGAVKTPQDYFFASFVYDNHWGAYMILIISACLGLALRHSAATGRGFLKGPAPFGFLAACLMAISVPLSGARACSILLLILLLASLVRGFPTVSHAIRHSGARPAAAYLGIAAAAAAAGWGAWAVAGDVIDARIAKTKEQVSAAWQQGGLGARSVLYHDTWRMARERPVFGWGMGSYPSVFPLYNTQEPQGDRIPVVYHDAHSDWLQSLSEIGFVGTALVGAAVLLPCASLRGRRRSDIPTLAFVGCGLVAAYAWVEFPFGNVAVVLGWWLCFTSAVQYVRLGVHPGVRRAA
jgi:O-antigen ligase